MKPNMKLASPVGMKTKAVKSRRIAWLLRERQDILFICRNQIECSRNIMLYF